MPEPSSISSMKQKGKKACWKQNWRQQNSGKTQNIGQCIAAPVSWTRVALGDGVNVFKGADNIYALGAVYKL